MRNLFFVYRELFTFTAVFVAAVALGFTDNYKKEEVSFMNHSIEAHLRRRTDDELEMALRMYIQQTDNEYYAWLVEIIQQILRERTDANEQN